MEEQERPLAAFLLSLIGGVLILIDGALLGVAGGVADALGNYAAGALLGNLGFLGGFLGFLVLLLGVGAFLAPQYHTGLGIGILVLSLLSIFGGGGFVIGLLLGDRKSVV